MRWVRGDIYVRHLFIKRTNKICKKNYVQKVYVMVLDADVELEEFVMFCSRKKSVWQTCHKLGTAVKHMSSILEYSTLSKKIKIQYAV